MLLDAFVADDDVAICHVISIVFLDACEVEGIFVVRSGFLEFWNFPA